MPLFLQSGIVLHSDYIVGGAHREIQVPTWFLYENQCAMEPCMELWVSKKPLLWQQRQVKGLEAQGTPNHSMQATERLTQKGKLCLQRYCSFLM